MPRVQMVLGLMLAFAAAAGCGGTAVTPIALSPTATVVANTPSAPTPQARSVEDEVRAAYLAYWDAYSRAVLNLDASLVTAVAAGEELTGIQQEIEGLRRQGVALRIVVQHDVAVVDLSERSATVLDRYVNNSFAVDAQTKDPPTAAGSGDVIQHVFSLERRDGRWLVVRSVRQR